MKEPICKVSCVVIGSKRTVMRSTSRLVDTLAWLRALLGLAVGLAGLCVSANASRRVHTDTQADADALNDEAKDDELEPRRLYILVAQCELSRRIIGLLLEVVGRKLSHRPGNPATVGVVRWPAAGDTAGSSLRRLSSLQHRICNLLDWNRLTTMTCMPSITTYVLLIAYREH